MIVKVHCPIPGCGTRIQVQTLPKHLERVHELDGELVLRLHPTAPYSYYAAQEVEQQQEQEQEQEQEPGSENESNE